MRLLFDVRFGRLKTRVSV